MCATRINYLLALCHAFCSAFHPLALLRLISTSPPSSSGCAANCSRQLNPHEAVLSRVRGGGAEAVRLPLFVRCDVRREGGRRSPRTTQCTLGERVSSCRSLDSLTSRCRQRNDWALVLLWLVAAISVYAPSPLSQTTADPSSNHPTRSTTPFDATT
jgi:hypothetical protein